jgi:glutamyl-tRNA synthetase
VSAPQRGVAELRYPGTCRARISASSQRGEALDRSALRFRVPEGPLCFTDGLCGPQSFDVSAEVGDFAISSRNNLPSYQLAVVVDDAEQGVNEVFRGDDLLSSTPRQILLQKALGLPHPAWFHIPLVLDGQGRRLAKRADDLSLETLRETGVDARAILGWVGRSAGLDVPERITAVELAAAYDLTQLRREPVSLAEADVALLLQAR